MAKPILPQMKPGKHTDRHMAEHLQIMNEGAPQPDPNDAAAKAKANAAAQMLKYRNGNKPDQFGYRTDDKGNVTEDGEE